MAFSINSFKWRLSPRHILQACCARLRIPCCPTMSSDLPIATSHEQVRIDKSCYAHKWSLYALRIPARHCQGAMIALKDHILRVPRVQTVRKAGDSSERVLLLRYFAEKPPDISQFSLLGNVDDRFVGIPAQISGRLRVSETRAKVKDGVMDFIRSISDDSVELATVDIAYDDWPAEAVLSNLLPDDVPIPSAYESVGHIVHLNLRTEHQPFKTAIASVLLEKLKPRIRTVVNKTESTGGPYRTFAMEILAGEPNLETTLKENGCVFHLHFAKVYWNSRLETEHRRIVDSLSEKDVLADAFCGIGPFAIPAAKLKKCKVLANDLNPSSVAYLKKNAANNGIPLATSDFQASCECARDFITRIVREDRTPITRVVMNFPSGAPDFLDVFSGLYCGLEGELLPMPTVNCYCFARGDDWEADAKNHVCAVLQPSSEAEKETMMQNMRVREVRDVAPKKRHVCITFRIPEFVAYRSKGDANNSHDARTPRQKRQRISS